MKDENKLMPDSEPVVEEACEPDGELSRDTDLSGENQAGESGRDSGSVDQTREGFAVFDPTIGSEDGSDRQDEWARLGEEVFSAYGDSLTGFAGYLGPVGGLLATLGAAVVIIRLAIPAASNVINIFILMLAMGAFIIGSFLLVFHLFHWMSNRAKGYELSRLSKLRLLNEPCGHLDITLDRKSMTLRCDYFRAEISESPECVVCPHYSNKIQQTDGGEAPGSPMESRSDDLWPSAGKPSTTVVEGSTIAEAGLKETDTPESQEKFAWREPDGNT